MKLNNDAYLIDLVANQVARKLGNTKPSHLWTDEQLHQYRLEAIQEIGPDFLKHNHL